VWGINNDFNLSLEKSDDEFIVVNKKGLHISKHTFYEYKDEDTMVNFFLIKNKCEFKFLIPENIEFDYFIFICEDKFNVYSDFLKRLKQVGSVLTAIELNPEEIKSTENLIFS